MPGTIVALALICGVTTGIFKIVSTAVVPMLVDDDELDAANGAILNAQTLTNVAGAALGGTLVGLTSANDVLLLNAVTFVLSGALLLAFSRVPRHAPPPPPGALATGSRAWLRALRRRRAPLPDDAGAAHDHVQPAGRVDRARHLDRRVGADAARHLRRIRTCRSARSWRSMRSASRSARAIPARYAGYLTGLGLLAIGWGGFGIAPDLWIAGPLSVVGGMGNGVVIVRFRTMMQRETPPHERASTIGFAYAMTFGMIVVGQVAVVPLVKALGDRATFTLAGTIFAAGGLVGGAGWPRTVRRARCGACGAPSRTAPPPVHDNHDYDK